MTKPSRYLHEIAIVITFFPLLAVIFTPLFDTSAGESVSRRSDVPIAVSTVPLSLPSASRDGNECKATVYFSPSGGCTEAIVNAIDEAKKSILVQAYSFTRSGLKSLT